MIVIFFFFNDTATTEIYTLSLHDALPISRIPVRSADVGARAVRGDGLQAVMRRQRHHGVELCLSRPPQVGRPRRWRSEEHTSELQSRQYLVCRLLLEKKKKSHYSVYVRTN